MSKKLLRSFTLVEVVFTVVIISIGFMSILYAINYALENVQSVRQRVIAINLAREGIEGIYQIRDTNRLFNPAKKDDCRLDMNPLIDESSDSDCVNDTWMGSGNYILQKINSGGQQTFSLSGGNWQKLDLNDGVNNDDTKFALCLSGGLRESCPGGNGPLLYFRQIHGEGLFYKNSNTTGGDYLDCQNGNSNLDFPLDLTCGGSEAKEYRFCSKVAYIGMGKGDVELCAMITNFAR